MKIKHTLLLLWLLLLLLPLACKPPVRLVAPLEQAQSRVALTQPQLKNMQAASAVDTASIPSNIVYTDKEGKEHQIVRADASKDKDGSDIMTVNLQSVTVVAKSKTVAERMGKINVDFVVSIPNTMIDNRWMVVLTPTLLQTGGKQTTLDRVVLNGQIFKLYQQKGKKELDFVSDRYRAFGNDTTHIARYYKDKYNLYMTLDARLDTIIERKGHLEYYYVQEIETTDQGKRVDVVMTGEVIGMDKSFCRLPLSDTLNYFISSMGQFFDDTPRFRKKIISRRVLQQQTAYIQFEVGKERIVDTLANNRTELDSIYSTLHALTWGEELVPDSIVMTAAASPEGEARLNYALSQRRAESLKAYLAKRLDDAEAIDTLIRPRSKGEDWDKLTLLLKQSVLTKADEIQAVIDQEKNLDVRENRIRQQFPDEYRYLRDTLYPRLRAVDLQFYLHRKGMIKDTIETTEPDIDYAEGLKLIQLRRYKEALAILVDYEDQNTAICYLSLGYDQMAYKILTQAPESANGEYLLSIAAARLQRDGEAVQHYLRSCELDESKRYRGPLDPEINRLIKLYGLKTDEE